MTDDELRELALVYAGGYGPTARLGSNVLALMEERDALKAQVARLRAQLVELGEG